MAARSAGKPAPARAGVHPSYAVRRSAAWSTPKTPDDSTGAEQPEATDRKPVLGFPAAFRADPEMPLDRIDAENDEGNVVGSFANVAPPFDMSAELPPAFAPPPSFEMSAALQLAPLTPKEIDFLWDWARSDREGVFSFLGFVPETAIALYRWCEGALKLQTDGRAWFQSVHFAGQVIGFVMLYPVTPTTKGLVGDCHIYLAKDVRGNLKALLPLLMAEADRAIPNIALRVETARDDEWVRLLRAVGFSAKIVLTRPAAAALTGGNVGP